MAMSNNFKLFAENATSGRVQTDADWAINTERLSGFISGQPANSVNVNTAIKTNSLISLALVDAIKEYGSSSVGLSTAEATIASRFKSALQNLAITNVKNDLTFTKTPGTAGTSGDTLNIALGGITLSQTVTNAVNAATSTKATYDAGGTKTIRSYVASLSVSNSTISAKDADGNTVSEVTITNPTAADRAAKDADGNVITSSYGASLSGNNTNTIKLISKSGAQLSSIVVNNVVNAVNATNVVIASTSNASNVVGFSIGTGIYSKTINNVAHATSADSATTAANATNATNVAISAASAASNVVKFNIGTGSYTKTIDYTKHLDCGTVGSTTRPVFMYDGEPRQCDTIQKSYLQGLTISGNLKSGSVSWTKPTGMSLTDIRHIAFDVTVVASSNTYSFRVTGMPVSTSSTSAVFRFNGACVAQTSATAGRLAMMTMQITMGTSSVTLDSFMLAASASPSAMQIVATGQITSVSLGSVSIEYVK